tara:strand:- start:12369 stop:12593 length:225 start_codon:yes stop_codon:yes gene_type:complete
VLQEIVEIEINLYKGEMRFCFKQVVVGKQSPKKSSLKHLPIIFSLVSRKNSGIDHLIKKNKSAKYYLTDNHPIP